MHIKQYILVLLLCFSATPLLGSDLSPECDDVEQIIPYYTRIFTASHASVPFVKVKIPPAQGRALIREYQTTSGDRQREAGFVLSFGYARLINHRRLRAMIHALGFTPIEAVQVARFAVMRALPNYNLNLAHPNGTPFNPTSYFYIVIRNTLIREAGKDRGQSAQVIVDQAELARVLSEIGAGAYSGHVKAQAMEILGWDEERYQRAFNAFAIRAPVAMIESLEAEVEEPGLDEDAINILDQAMQAIPANRRAIIIEHAVQGRSFSQIAAELGCSKSNVQKQYNKGIAQLRREFPDLVARIEGV